MTGKLQDFYDRSHKNVCSLYSSPSLRAETSDADSDQIWLKTVFHTSHMGRAFHLYVFEYDGLKQNVH